MSDKDVVDGSVMEGAGLTVEQFCTVIAVEQEWIVRHVEDGLFSVSGTSVTEWRFSSADLRRAERMRMLERNFDAAPELAALVADLQAEMDELRARLKRAGLGYARTAASASLRSSPNRLGASVPKRSFYKRPRSRALLNRMML